MELSEPLGGVPFAEGESPPVQDATATATTIVSTSARPHDDQRCLDPSRRRPSRQTLDLQAPRVRVGLLTAVRGIGSPARWRALAWRTPRRLACAVRILGSWHRRAVRAMARLGHTSIPSSQPPAVGPTGVPDRPPVLCRSCRPTPRRGSVRWGVCASSTCVTPPRAGHWSETPNWTGRRRSPRAGVYQQGLMRWTDHRWGRSLVKCRGLASRNVRYSRWAHPLRRAGGLLRGSHERAQHVDRFFGSVGRGDLVSSQVGSWPIRQTSAWAGGASHRCGLRYGFAPSCTGRERDPDGPARAVTRWSHRDRPLRSHWRELRSRPPRRGREAELVGHRHEHRRSECLHPDDRVATRDSGPCVQQSGRRGRVRAAGRSGSGSAG